MGKAERRREEREEGIYMSSRECAVWCVSRVQKAGLSKVLQCHLQRSSKRIPVSDPSLVPESRVHLN